jgi:zinc protease
MKLVRLSFLRRLTLAIAALCGLFPGLRPAATMAQVPEPQRQQLLNGLQILLLPRPGDQNVLLKLRIHSGAAFDPAGKAGTMALLGDILFPETSTHEYFAQELEGRLVVETDHDGITLTLQGHASDYDRIVDILRAALVTTQITPENFAKVRDLRIRGVTEAKQSGAGVADQEIARRLLGSFPYTSPLGGTVESLKRIERGDLMLARDKFLSPNNASLVIIGGVDERRAMRALRQLLGGWRKSDQVVPASFRQPPPVDQRILIANVADSPTAQVRLAVRGLARADGDFFAAHMLTVISEERWKKLLPDVKGRFSVQQDEHALPGMFLLSASVDGAAVPKVIAGAQSVLKSLAESPVTAAELEKVKSDGLAVMNRSLAQNDMLAEAWLEADTYSLPTVNDQVRAWSAISAADLQKVAVRLFHETQVATVVAGNVDSLKAQLSTSKIEVLGEAMPKAPAPRTAPTTTPAATTPVEKHAAPILPKARNPLIKDTRPLTKP